MPGVIRRFFGTDGDFEVFLVFKLCNKKKEKSFIF